MNKSSSLVITIAVMLASAATPAAAQDPAAVIDENTASIEVLIEGMRKFPDDPEWTFVEVDPEDVYFPGDIYEYSKESYYDRKGYYGRDSIAVEKWYLSQIPERFDNLKYNYDRVLKVLYLPGCNFSAYGDADRILPGEGAGYGDFNDEQWNRARLEMALEQAGLSRELGAYPMANLQPADLRRINLELLRKSSDPRNPAELLLVLRGYCGLRTTPPHVPGMPFLPPPLPLPPPAPVRVFSFFVVDLPQGIGAVRIGRGVDARKCRQRNLPLEDPRCLPHVVDERTPVPFVREGRYVFTGRRNGAWVSGNVSVKAAQTYSSPTPPENPPPGRTFASLGYSAINLILIDEN